MTSAIIQTGGATHVDPTNDPADRVSEDDLQQAKSNSRFWQDASWTPYTQGQELFAQAKKDGVPLYLEHADGSTIGTDTSPIYSRVTTVGPVKLPTSRTPVGISIRFPRALHECGSQLPCTQVIPWVLKTRNTVPNEN